MLLVCNSISELSMNHLQDVYGENDLVLRYMEEEFFSVQGALCCVWTQNGVYRSVLRLEPYEDGLLITGLETAPDSRRMGNASKLFQAVVSELQPHKLYSHVDMKNRPSLRFHRKFGFKQVCDFARYIDGTVSANAVTLLLEINS